MKTVLSSPGATSTGGGLVHANNPCANCDVRSRAVCGVLNDAELSRLARVNRRRELEAGDCIFLKVTRPTPITSSLKDR